MAEYKVLQDIEAEDKLLGPLTLRQFIYAVIVVVLGFVAFKLASIGWYLALPFLPPLVFFGLLAAPFGRDQSSEVWLLAKIKFFIFPRRRIWDQSGIQDLVTITVPKRVEKHLTKDFDRDEARSRLKALANTMDTRGWVIKNASTNTFNNRLLDNSSDRLLTLESAPEDTSIVKPSDDVLDPDNAPAQQMESMVAQSDEQHRKSILEHMQIVAQADALIEAAAAKAVPVNRKSTPPTPEPAPAPAPTQPMTQQPPAAIIKPVKKQGSQSTLQIQKDDDNEDAGEVVISLH